MEVWEGISWGVGGRQSSGHNFRAGLSGNLLGRERGAKYLYAPHLPCLPAFQRQSCRLCAWRSRPCAGCQEFQHPHCPACIS